MNLIRFNQYPLFNDLFENLERNFSNQLEESKGDIPAVNITEQNDRFVLEMAAPGLQKSDFQINLDNYVLTISSEKKEEKKEKSQNFTRREFLYNSFKRTFTLPKSIDAEKISADYQNGILTLQLPKKEQELKVNRQIEIK
ncbi:MAG: Hsp20/alpha crystallin family protein [Bacteroidales bacterium]|nr:Hsp20/alpha crystallin family protein [Bacteroidales bacterium]